MLIRLMLLWNLVFAALNLGVYYDHSFNFFAGIFNAVAFIYCTGMLVLEKKNV